MIVDANEITFRSESKWSGNGLSEIIYPVQYNKTSFVSMDLPTTMHLRILAVESTNLLPWILSP